MQTALVLGLRQRVTYYNCLNYVRQLTEGDRYHELRPAISICVLNKILFDKSAAFHLSFRLRCDQENLVLTDDLEMHLIELPKFHRSNTEIPRCSALEKWLYFLQHAEHLDADELRKLLPGAAFEEAIGVLEMIARTPEEREFYDSRLKLVRDEEARLLFARIEGREEGREEGRQEGIEKGLLAGKIQLLQQLLGKTESPMSDLENSTVTELYEMLQTLQAELRSRDT